MLTKKDKAKWIQKVIPKLHSRAQHRIFKILQAKKEKMTETSRYLLVNLCDCDEETVDAIYREIFTLE